MILCFDIGGSRIKAGRAGADGAVGHGGLHKRVAFISLYSTARRGFAQGLCGKKWKIQIGSSKIHSNKIF
jgi:hypothetical protein